MVNYRKLAVKLATAIAIALTSFVWILPVQAVEQHFELSSEQGYRLETNLVYEEAGNSMLSEQGKGKTKAIDFLQVHFYDPNGKIIASYDNIVDGIGQGEYFELNYDPHTQKIVGNVDLGGESAGEMYLQGNVESGLSLIKIGSTGEEKTIDSSAWRLGDVE